jgi:hypothetical protein
MKNSKAEKKVRGYMDSWRVCQHDIGMKQKRVVESQTVYCIPNYTKTVYILTFS